MQIFAFVFCRAIHLSTNQQGQTHRRQMLWAYCLALLAVATLWGCSTQPPRELRLEVAPGYAWQWEWLQEQTRTMLIDSQLVTTQRSTGAVYKMTHLGTDSAGHLVFRQELAALWVQQRDPNGSASIVFDSRNDTDSLRLRNRLYAALVGQATVFRLNRQGVLVAVDSLPKLPSVVEAPQLHADDLPWLSGQSQARLVLQLFVPFAEVAVATGDFWVHAPSATAAQVFRQQRNYILDACPTPDSCLLQVRASLRPDSTHTGTRYGTYRLRTQLTGTEKGELSLDPTTGLLWRANWQTELEGLLLGEETDSHDQHNHDSHDCHDHDGHGHPHERLIRLQVPIQVTTQTTVRRL
jgi:hypothetical protein